MGTVTEIFTANREYVIRFPGDPRASQVVRRPVLDRDAAGCRNLSVCTGAAQISTLLAMSWRHLMCPGADLVTAMYKRRIN